MSEKKSSNSKSRAGIWECKLSELKAGTEGLSFIGNPKVVKSPYGNALLFNGENDAIFISDNPLKNLTSFTIEVLIRPDLNGPEEQRFLHFGEIDSDRLLIETRSTKEGNWYLDTFFMIAGIKKVLIDPKLIHPIGPWYHIALTIDDKGQMTNYVNSKKELDEHSDFSTLKSGEMSIGVRRNKISWYKGAIYKIKVSPGVLDKKEFMSF
jgi:hypothetical protein